MTGVSDHAVDATGGPADGPAGGRRGRRGPSDGGSVPAWRTAASGLGQLLITAGFVILLFVGYELWFTGVYTHQEQDKLLQGLEQTWTHDDHKIPGTVSRPAQPSYDKVPVGAGVAVLYIPRLGRQYHYVVVEGVDRESLKKGPGHYPGTALPGQVGNLVVSGHRTTYLAPFNRIDELRTGDAVIFETADTWYVYQVTGQEIVSPDAIGETAPVPMHPGEQQTKGIFTFTTCNPKYSAQQRLIVHGVLVSSRARSQGAPPDIAAVGRG